MRNVWCRKKTLAWAITHLTSEEIASLGQGQTRQIRKLPAQKEPLPRFSLELPSREWRMKCQLTASALDHIIICATVRKTAKGGGVDHGIVYEHSKCGRPSDHQHTHWERLETLTVKAEMNERSQVAATRTPMVAANRKLRSLQTDMTFRRLVGAEQPWVKHNSLVQSLAGLDMVGH